MILNHVIYVYTKNQSVYWLDDKKTITIEQLTHNYRLKNYPLHSYKKNFLIDASRLFGNGKKKKKNELY